MSTATKQTVRLAVGDTVLTRSGVGRVSYIDGTEIGVGEYVVICQSVRSVAPASVTVPALTFTKTGPVYTATVGALTVTIDKRGPLSYAPWRYEVSVDGTRVMSDNGKTLTEMKTDAATAVAIAAWHASHEWDLTPASTDVAAPCAPTVPTAGGTDSTDVVTVCVFERDGVETGRMVCDDSAAPLTVESVDPWPARDLPADWEEWTEDDDEAAAEAAARAEWEAEEEAALNAEFQETQTADTRDAIHGDTTPHVREYLARLLHGPKRTLALALYAARVLPADDSATDPADVAGVTDDMRRNVERSLGKAMRKDGHPVAAYAF
jgi:hypothetical protein